MNRIETLIENVKNQQIEVSDSTNKNQCMDFVYLYLFTLNFPKVTIQHLYAYEAFTKPNDTTRKYFEIIPNTPEFVPQQGDIGVFGTEVGVAGHICVIDEGSTLSKIVSWDQNWAGVQRVVKVTHSYGGKNGFLGVLRPRWEMVNSCLISSHDEGKKLFERLVHNSGVADETVKYLGLAEKADSVDFSTVKNSLEAREGKLTSCKTELTTRESELAGAKQEIENRIEQLSRVKEQLTISEEEKKDAVDALKSARTEHEVELTKALSGQQQLQNKLDAEAKAKGTALNELATVKAQLKQAEKGQYESLTFSKWLSLLSIVKWK